MHNRRTLLAIGAALGLGISVPSAFAQSPRRIQLAQLETMFENMRTKTKWNVDGPLLWGYFFLDQSPEKLKSTAAELETKGYRVVAIGAIQSRQVYRLHVEKVEAHTPASLHVRNTELYELADRLSLASYDGMDVGPPPAPRQ